MARQIPLTPTRMPRSISKEIWLPESVRWRTFILILFTTLFVILAGCNRAQPGKTSNNNIIIFRDADGRALTMKDLHGATGTFRYEIVGNRDVPAKAQLLHQQGRQAGAKGDYSKALALLEQASELAPQWPYPMYDMAYTHLLMKDYDGAREYYRKTLSLSPRGFYTAITAVDTLEKEEKGTLPTGTYLAYLSLEWVEDQGKKARAVRQFVKRLPQFAPGWKELATLADDDREMLAAIEKGLATNPDAETKGMLHVNRALIIERQGEHDSAVRILGELALDPNSPFDIEHIAKVTLANIIQK
jgi:tetratricopeptide (TPR) repeat protein